MRVTIDPTAGTMVGLKAPPPRAAYVHVPFCRYRCGYCNFTLVAGRSDLIADYLCAIDLELSRLAEPHEVDTLYFGGGTPTYLSPQQLRQLATSVLHWHPLASGYEWTVEANPVDVDVPMIDSLRDAGVTRLSLGAQSFQPEKLQFLERDHGNSQIRAAAMHARRAGMQLAVDLMFGTPKESLETWVAELDAVLELEPEHISTYGLTIERGSAFWGRWLRGGFAVPDEGLQRDMYAAAIDHLTAAGFEHYEVSNFARPGCRSRHNEVYWSGDSYFAVGPGAARYLAGVRETNHRSTTTYLRRVLRGESPVAEREQLSPEGRARELLVFSLRRLAGLSRREFEARTGFQVDQLCDGALRKFVLLGLLSDDGDVIRLTRVGLFVSDSLWPELL